jgi:hypothetical protein
MERVLNEREKAGVPDAVLLERYEDEEVFIENLEKRFNENIIYVRRMSIDITVNVCDVIVLFFLLS